MYGSLFDPFGYVNDRQPRRKGYPQRPRFDDFDPFGFPFPFRPNRTYDGDEGDNSDTNSENEGEMKQGYSPNSRIQDTHHKTYPNRRNEVEYNATRSGDDQHRPRRYPREIYEDEFPNKTSKYREISNKTRQAQYERAKRQEEIRRRQRQQQEKEHEKPTLNIKGEEFEHMEQTKPPLTKQNSSKSIKKNNNDKDVSIASVPHTLLKSSNSFILAANIPGYPADAVQISATPKKITVTLHQVHLILPDASPLEGYPLLDSIIGQSPDAMFEITLPSRISVDDSNATLSGGRLLINLPIETEGEISVEKEETHSARVALEQFNKKLDEDAEDWTGILKGLGADKETLEHELLTPSTLIPITML